MAVDQLVVGAADKTGRTSKTLKPFKYFEALPNYGFQKTNSYFRLSSAICWLQLSADIYGLSVKPEDATGWRVVVIEKLRSFHVKAK